MTPEPPLTQEQADGIRAIIERAAERDPAVRAVLDRLVAEKQAELVETAAAYRRGELTGQETLDAILGDLKRS